MKKEYTKKIKIGGKNGCCLINASTLSKNDSFEKIYYLDTSNITKNKINNIQKISRANAPSRAQRKVNNNTIIYSSVRPNLEHFGFIENPIENFIVSSGFITLDIIDEDVEPKYLYYLITQKDITNYLHTIAMGSVSAYPSINPNDIANLSFVIPKSKMEQKKISSILSVLDSKIELNNKINDNLS
ncbi:MAG: hypothetical protein B7Y83_01320 [Flavobacteriales bacterium 32-34-25]|nr:MAG: hypothetical protein B7Y83_01320 [Flavobacteriales bacterium 32-34-25]